MKIKILAGESNIVTHFRMKLAMLSTASEQVGPRFLKALTMCPVYMSKLEAYFPAYPWQPAIPISYPSSKINQMKFSSLQLTVYSLLPSNLKAEDWRNQMCDNVNLILEIYAA